MGFTKLDSSIVNSSIWSEPLATRILWITMLAMCDENGFVASSIPGLQRAANISQEDFNIGIKIIESPDPFSRTPDFEGRRADKVAGGWIILNFIKYREHSVKVREQTKVRVREYRKRKAGIIDVTLRGVTGALPSASDSSSDSESESSKRDTVPKRDRGTTIPHPPNMVM